MRFADRIAIVTGAASGIGEQTVYRFAQEGATVAIVDVDERGAAEVRQRILDRGFQAVSYPVDVSVEQQVSAAVADIVERYGRIDILFNNAGIGFSSNERYRMAPLVDTPALDWRAILDINLGGVFLFSKYVLPIMEMQRRGVVINNSSVMALSGYPGADAYTAAKGGIISLTRSMAVQYGPVGIRVNCICPGIIRTPMQGGNENNPEAIADMSRQIPLRRMGEPKEIADVVAFLASDEASYLTAAIVPIDGGFSG